MKSDRSAALLLMGAAIIGIVIANSPFGPAFLDFKHAYVGFESIGLSLSVEHWVSDLLLATFFLVAGLELKYELSSGVLSKPASALVPVLAGIGGVVVPALIYVAFNWGTDYLNGWPIPTATDIAFALGVLAIFGRGLPKSARVFLLALAIFDDLVAILIIAVFFTSDVEVLWLAAAAVIAALHMLMEKFGKLPINYVRVFHFYPALVHGVPVRSSRDCCRSCFGPDNPKQENSLLSRKNSTLDQHCVIAYLCILCRGNRSSGLRRSILERVCRHSCCLANR